MAVTRFMKLTGHDSFIKLCENILAFETNAKKCLGKLVGDGASTPRTSDATLQSEKIDEASKAGPLK